MTGIMKTKPYSAVEDFLRKNYLDIFQTVSIQLISRGVENQNYLVETGKQAYVLRVYSRDHSITGSRKRAEIEFELDFMEHVRGQGVPAPEVIKNSSGAKINEMFINEKFHYSVLFSFIQGEEALAYNSENARSMAETLLKLHKASQIYQYETVRRWPGNIVGSSLAYYQENRGLSDLYRHKLDSIYAQAADGYKKIQSLPFPIGIVHGDIKLENVLFEGNHVIAILDFDDYRESYLVEELTRTVMHDLHSVEQNVIRSGQFELFRGVFARDDSISAAEMGYFDIFLKARFLYDITVYIKNGLNGLVEELFVDPHVAEIILA